MGDSIMEMKNVYKSLNEQKLYYEQELIRKKNVLKDTKEERKNITIKKIHGELYYYAQCKRAGKVNSQYLGPVIPGTIKELEWNIESLEKMMEYYKKREKKEPVMNNFSFEVYWKDEITARVYVKKKKVIVSRYTENPGKQLFASKEMTRFQLGKIMEMRCWEKGRPDINEILNHLGLSEYNPYEIVRKHME